MSYTYKTPEKLVLNKHPRKFKQRYNIKIFCKKIIFKSKIILEFKINVIINQQ